MRIPTEPNNKLIWIDMEMTGLDLEKKVIIEVAAIVTDMNLKIFDEYETVVKQPQHYLDNMDDWNRKHHGESGLLARVPRGQEPTVVENELIQLAKKHFPFTATKSDKPILAGNSIMQDRLFINKYMPRFASLLHYRMMDVTAWKIMYNARFGLKYEKKNSHRALDDIHESLGELKFYLDHIQSR